MFQPPSITSLLCVSFFYSIVVVLLDLRGRLVILIGTSTIRSVVVAKGLDVVLEGALVLEVGATDAIPKLATVLLMGSPVTADSEGLATLSAGEGLQAVLALVVSLEGSKVLERLGSWVVYVVATPRRAAVARQPQHPRWLSPPQRLWPLPVL